MGRCAQEIHEAHECRNVRACKQVTSYEYPYSLLGQPNCVLAKMQPSPYKDTHAAALGQRGGQIHAERLNAQERSAIARHAARARWHPREAQAAREQAQELAYLVQHALKNGKQLPLI